MKLPATTTRAPLYRRCALASIDACRACVRHLDAGGRGGGAEAGVGAVCESMILQLLAVQWTSPAVGPCGPAATIESE
eukprot:5087999-Prymnesium_polylepis.2